MSASRFIQILDIKNVAAGKTAVATFPAGRNNVKRVIFRTGDSSAANANAPALNAVINPAQPIQMKAYGAIQRSIHVTHLDALNALRGAEFASQAYAGNTNGLPNANGAGRRDITMWFEEPDRTRIRRDSVDPNVMGFRTGWLPQDKPLQFYVPLNAGITPVLEVFAEVDDDDNGEPYRLMKYFTEDENVNTATANIMNFQKGIKPGDRFAQLSVFNTSDGKLPVSVRLEINDTVIYEDVPVSVLHTINKGNRLDYSGANSIANGVHLVFDANDSLDDTIPGSFAKSKLQVGLSAAANGSIPTVIQRWGLPEGL